MGSFFKAVVPIAASFLAPGIGSALGLSGTLGSVAGGALAGGLGNALTGGNILTGALTGGAGGALGSAVGGASGLADGAGGFSDVIANNASNAGTWTGTGLLDSASRGLSELTSGIGLSSGGGSSMFGNSEDKTIFDSILGGSSDGATGMFNTNLKLGDLLGGVNSYLGQDAIADEQRKALEQAQGFIGPWLSSGTDANRQLGDLLGLNGPDAGSAAMASLTNSPAYQFRLKQGQDAIDKNLAAQGLTGSGAAVKAASDYAQNSASEEINNVIQNLMAQSGRGMQAGGAMGNIASNIGQVNAAREVGQGNIVNQALSGLFGSKDSTEQLLSQLMQRQYGMA